MVRPSLRCVPSTRWATQFDAALPGALEAKAEQKPAEEPKAEEKQADQAEVVVDSGTCYHIFRDYDKFASVNPNSSVKIRGVNGISKGLRGILRDNTLGTGAPDCGEWVPCARLSHISS